MNEKVAVSGEIKNEIKTKNSGIQIHEHNLLLPITSPAYRILFLQRTIGNHAVGKLLRSGAFNNNYRIPVIQRDPENPGGTPELQLSRPEEIALSRSSPGEFTGVAEPLSLSLYNFGIDVAQPKKEHREVLSELGRFLGETSTVPITLRVIGFADSSGDELYNLKLSTRRAEAVRSILQPSVTQRISISAYGETNPAAPNETVSGRSRNRRVDIRFAVQRPPTLQPLPRPEPVPPGQQPPQPGPQPPGTQPPGGGGGEEHSFCEKYPILCGIGITPFFLPLICLVAPEVCIAATCILVPELCLIPLPPPPPSQPPERPPRREDGDRHPIVTFVPAVRSQNTPFGMRDRISLRDPVNITAVVINPPAPTSPITIDVDGTGQNGGIATINGQTQIQIMGTTLLEILGTQMSAENFAYNPYLQLAAWWSNDLVGSSNRFAVSAIAQNWSAALDSVEVTRFGYAFYTKMDWVSDSGAYPDLDACRYVELVDVIEENGGMTGMGTGEVNDPDVIETCDLHPTFDQHGTPHEYTRVAGHSRLKQLFRIRDMRSNSGWAPSRNSGFEIERRFERDPANPRCWHLAVRKRGAPVTIGSMNSGAGVGNVHHDFRNINCDPPPPPPGHDEPPPPPPPPQVEPPTTPPHSGPPACDRAELARRVDQCIEEAKQGAIECTLGVILPAGGWGGVGQGIEYLICLERVRRALLECDRRAKADTNCPDSLPPPLPEEVKIA